MALLNYINAFFYFLGSWTELEQFFMISFSEWLCIGVNGNTNTIISIFLGFQVDLGLFFAIGLSNERVVVLMTILMPLFSIF